MSSLASLPDEVLKLVMQHVSLKDRLTCCCLVSRKLHTAAVAATDGLRFGYDYKSSTYGIPWQQEAVTQWISLYGQHLSSLEVNSLGARWPLLQQLPCHELQELKMRECSVQLGAADGHQGVIQGCIKLTRLEVWCCNIIDAPEGAVVDSLSSLVHLQHLVVRGMIQGNHPSSDTDYLIGGLSDVTLPRLQHLTYLELEGMNDQNLLQLQHLTCLKSVWIQYAGDGAVGPSSVPGLVLPASLTKLILLSPVEAGMLSLVPAELQGLHVECVVAGPTDGPGSLLSGMAHLQHLTELSLRTDDRLPWPPLGPAYSALTASSKLVNLELSGFNCPHRAWWCMFPAGRTLPHLTCLRLIGEEEDDPVAALVSPSWGAMDLFSLVSCCPRLSCIWGLPMQHGTHVSELQRLTTLKVLDAYFDRADLASFMRSVEGLSALTQLGNLWVSVDCLDLNVSALLPLTSLTDLTCFTLHNRFVDADFESELKNLEFRSWPQAGSSPDVWLQLLEQCAADGNCQPRVMRSLAHQLAEQRALTLTEQQRVCAHQQHIAHQHQQIASLQWQVSTQHQHTMVLQQQLAAQQQFAAQQAAQIAALQQQLQQVLQHLKS